MEPINYMLNVPNPATAVFEGYAQGLNTSAAQQQIAQSAAQEARAAELQPFAVEGAQLGLDQTRQGMDIRGAQEARAAQLAPLQQQQAQLGIQNTQQQIEQRQQEQQRAVEFQDAMGELASLGGDMTLADIQGVVTLFPEYGESVVGSFQAMNDAQKGAVSGILGQAAFALKNGSTETALDLIDEYAAAAAASGNEELSATAQGIKMVAEQDPNAALAAIGPALFSLDPDMAGKIFDAGTDEPADVRALRIRAEQAGLIEGTEEYRQFMLNGGAAPATFRALQMQAAAAGLEEGTPEYSEFMATRGAGQQAAARTTATNEANIATGGQAAEVVAAGSTRGAAIAKAGVEALESAPSIIAKSQSGMDLIDSIISDPALPSILGAVQGRMTPGTPATGGGAGADLAAKIDQLQGQAFLSAFASLKGGGTITEVEGLKAEQALARLQRTQSPEGYVQSLREFRAVLEAAKQRAEGNLVPDVFEGTAFTAQQSAPQSGQPAVPSYLQQFGGQ